MGQTSGAPLGTGGLRALNQPQAADVAIDERGIPRLVRIGGQEIRVTGISDVWRVEDGWWREPEWQVSRMYFELTLENGAQVTCYQDLLRGSWHEQRA